MKGKIIDYKAKFQTGRVRGADGAVYILNKKTRGQFTEAKAGQPVEFTADGDRVDTLTLLEMVEPPPPPASKPAPEAEPAPIPAAASTPRPATSSARPPTRQGAAAQARPPASSGGGYRFLNPYNFVRLIQTDRQKLGTHLLGSVPPPPHDRYTGLSGRITVKLEAVSPLFVSDSHAAHEETTIEGKKHTTYRFFEYDGKPSIPASSLRGMLRSMYEMLTNSCMAVLSDKTLSYHYPSRQATWLTPARVEVQNQGAEDIFSLRLLTGTSNLETRQAQGFPRGNQRAAWLYSFWPLKPSKTLRGIYDPRATPQARTVAEAFRQKRRRGQTIRNLFQHGEECFALIEEVQHGIPNVKFWDVVELSRDENALKKKINPGKTQRVVRGWVCLNNQNIEAKHSERFFFSDVGTHPWPDRIALPPKARKAYETLIQDYQERHKDAVEKLAKPNLPHGEDDAAFSRFIVDKTARKLKDGDLVYVMLAGNEKDPKVEFIAPVLIPRLAYEHSIASLLQKHQKPCTDLQALCPACRVFGWVNQKNADSAGTDEQAYAGRVRLTHARVDGKYETLDTIPLSILSGPKPTTNMFYLLDAQGKPSSTVNYDTYQAHLRGRKMYRHFGNWADLTEQEKHMLESEFRSLGDAKSDQNRSVQGALKPGAQFSFDLEFENLAELELGALLYALQLEEGMVHRLGYAKPLGFGSVRLTVQETRVVDWSARLDSVGVKDGWMDLSEFTGKSAAELAANFRQTMEACYPAEFPLVWEDLRALLGSTPGKPVHYPRPEKDRSSDGKQFEWFMGNTKRAQGGNLPPPKPLPLPPDDQEGLPLIDKRGDPVD
jgi:CRISPR-associated protein (TIGR03986 family)